MEEIVEKMSVDTNTLLEVSVLPVSVEYVVRENPGTTRVDARRVETVMVLELSEDTAIVETRMEDPVSVENWERENPGTVSVDALMVETKMD
jgi:hypothetical protein